ncbi:cAMP-binding domain of CRP or a regulatory subunit of cAMP-dependent protein kinases [Celeribacter baekdonensis]|uniref:cAMP-binding domain of CRP or a regulatory subunit of cAMP-dependent protein kinases n=1 Tax=Celeribacter baekdonensis TaxID=875171 RepID=A0A1G7MWT1_9RHOB|nr:Crp/Fnr family transcriptional regulator [Celeribacter baekdonensis]SDF66137.1 cAMP-binding domain of CRP or a regulatory subunit of cAMP-dependent protein kinases [Celeribacter baekdonensis]
MSDTAKTLPRLDESLLSHVPPFSKLEKRQIREILDMASVRRLGEGVAVFEEGAPAERFYMLLDGYIRVMRITATGEQVIALHIPSGQLFGIARAIGRDTYPATSVTASEAIILSWPMRVWDDFVARYDGFATETYKTLGQRLGEMNNRIVEMATQQVEQRVANALLRLINQTGRKVEGGIEIDFPITRQDLSEMTATTLHTVSRLLSAWEKQGLVSSRRKRITVTDPHRLVLMCRGGVPI